MDDLRATTSVCVTDGYVIARSGSCTSTRNRKIRLYLTAHGGSPTACSCIHTFRSLRSKISFHTFPQLQGKCPRWLACSPACQGDRQPRTTKTNQAITKPSFVSGRAVKVCFVVPWCFAEVLLNACLSPFLDVTRCQRLLVCLCGFQLKYSGGTSCAVILEL
jgi:hypothetical protein